MNVYAEFTPKHFEKALDIARHIASYAKLEFLAESVRMTAIDPAKVMYMHTSLFPTTYKLDKELTFGINLNMMYKLMKSFDNNIPIEMEVLEEKMVITQIGHRHELSNQPLQYDIPEIKSVTGPVLELETKLFQKHVRALSNVSPVCEISYDSASNSLFLESVNSLYRTLFAVNTEKSNNDAWPTPYKNRFIVKFIESAVNPSLGDTILLELGDFLLIRYQKEGMQVAVTVANYTEG